MVGAGASLGAATLLAGCNDSPVLTTVATTATTTVTTTTTTTPTTATGPTDADILNFALNLEYLEAEFYLRAATGNGLATADIGTSPGAVTGGSMVPGLTSEQQSYINEIAYDEQKHVQFLRAALGSAAVARPAIDLTNSFNALAMGALIGSTFNPFANFDSFLLGAFIFEDVGVTAYHGAAPLISTTATGKTYLAAAAGILAVEAYHAAVVRTTLTGRAIAAAAAGTPYPYLDYANKVVAFRSYLGGGNETALTLPANLTTASSIVAADTTNAIAFSRSTDQVLHIVYGKVGAGASSGVFFPSGLNGTIKTSAS